MSITLDDLRGLRSAPALSADDCRRLRAELEPLLAACDWFTIGVMAADGNQAITTLRAFETQLGWQALEADPSSPMPDAVPGAAFLKGNQNTGRFQLRPEEGVGRGVLITGHCAANPDAENTWGPLPLDLFG